MNSLVRSSTLSTEINAHMIKVYWIMCIGLLITGTTSYLVATNETWSSSISYHFNLIALVWFLFGILATFILTKVGEILAHLLFFIYSFLTGLVLSSIFLAFSTESISSTFFITAGIFVAMSAYGYFTKKDLTNFGAFLFMALIGIILASVVNLFLHSGTLNWIVSFISVFVFTGLTAYDTQKIKSFSFYTRHPVYSAFSLYLNFINLFLNLLRIFGRK